MKQQYLIVGIVIVTAILLFIVRIKLKSQKAQPDTDTARPPENLRPLNIVNNDKLVVVEDVDGNDIKKIILEFCNTYNKETYQAIPRLIEVSDRKFAITFPFDIDFEIFCYFINYVHYPIGFDRHFKATGWATTKPTDMWITNKSANKNVMLFVTDFDTEYDNVFLTTQDNIGYKLGFAAREKKQLLNNPEKDYVKPFVTLSELRTKEYIEFK